MYCIPRASPAFDRKLKRQLAVCTLNVGVENEKAALALLTSTVKIKPSYRRHFTHERFYGYTEVCTYIHTYMSSALVVSPVGNWLRCLYE